MQRSSTTVYDYDPGIWATVVGGLLIFLPLMCIPLFVLISLCKVSAIISRLLLSDLGGGRSSKIRHYRFYNVSQLKEKLRFVSNNLLYTFKKSNAHPTEH